MIATADQLSGNAADAESTRPDWTRLAAPPSGGWGVYRRAIRRAIEAIFSGEESDALTAEAVAWLTQGDAARRVELAEVLAGYRVPFVGRMRVLPIADAPGNRGRLFEPAHHGERAIDALVAVEWLAFDLTLGVKALEAAAWPVGDPGRWRLRRGAVEILGEARLDAAFDDRRKLRIYPTPAAWLAGEAYRPGVCVVVDRRDVWRRFEGLPALVCDDEDHHGEVYRVTRRPVPRALPKILVER